MDRGRAAAILAAYRGLKVVVLGDLMLDHFIWGSVSRISPEAPVPVVRVKRESFHLGGAGNVTANLAALGAIPVPVGSIGADEAGKRLVEGLAALGAPRDGIVEIPSRTTTKKTRIVAHAQQVVRFDREDDAPLPAGIPEKLLGSALAALRGAKALIVSDYEKGTASEPLLASLLPEARRLGVTAVVDPKPAHFAAYRPITAITPNTGEASQMAGIAIRDDESAERAARKILETLECPAVLLTRGESGMLLCERGSASVAIPAAAREVYDVTGAGDTVASVFALTLAAGGTPRESAEIANVAASIVVGKVGTATATVEEILAAL